MKGHLESPRRSVLTEIQRHPLVFHFKHRRNTKWPFICLPRRSSGDTASDLGGHGEQPLTGGSAAPTHLDEFYLGAQIASVTDLTAQLHRRDVHASCPKERGGGHRKQVLTLQFDSRKHSHQVRAKGNAGALSFTQLHGAEAWPTAERPACCVHLPSINGCRPPGARLTGSCFHRTFHQKLRFQLDPVTPGRTNTLQQGGGSRHVHALSLPHKNKE